MIIEFDMPEPDGMVFAPGCFDGQIGKRVPVKDADGRVIGTGAIRSVRSYTTAQSVTFTMIVDTK